MTPEEANREQALTALVDHVLRWPNDPALSPTAWSLAQGYLTLKARLSAVEAERDQLKEHNAGLWKIIIASELAPRTNEKDQLGTVQS